MTDKTKRLEKYKPKLFFFMRLACSAGNMDLLVEIKLEEGGWRELDKSIKMAEIVFIQCSCHPDKNVRFFFVSWSIQ